MSTPADFPPPVSSSECLVLVSDTSTEAERLIASLRVRGFKVRDVPLMLLAGRVEVQRPRLVICDGQATNAAASITKMREGTWGSKVELLLLGTDAKTSEVLRQILPDIDERTFLRPIDVYSVLQRVEEVIGMLDVASRPGSRSMAALPRVSPSAPSAATRLPTPAPRGGRSSMPHSSQRLDSLSAAARGDSHRNDTSRAEAADPSSPRNPSIAPPSDPSNPEAIMPGLAAARMSEELELLLSEADKRLANGPVSIQPISMSGARLSPEQELDAILPPDVLAALDESVDLDEDDETSHPVVRAKDRPVSARPPRGAHVGTNEPRHTTQTGPAERSTSGSSPLDDDTPVGRLAARGRLNTTAGMSEPPDASPHGSV
ncbi:MAG TPA: hypothetical protein VIV60_09705, partial [Polyangiaceae bacterium]